MDRRVSRIFFVTQIALRGLAAMLSFIAIIIMVASAESAMVFGINFPARYSYFSTFRYMLDADIVICVCSIISLLITWLSYAPNSTPRSYFLLFIATILMMSGCATATVIGYVGRYGQDQTGWAKICDNVNKSCHFINISICFSFLAFICLFILTLMAFTKNHF